MDFVPPPLLIGVLLLEFIFTHSTHVFGYLFIVLILIARLYLVEHKIAVSAFFDIFLFWFLISYAKTGPQYNGQCMMIDVYNSHLYVYLIHYFVVVWIAVSRFLKPQFSKIITSIDRYLWLVLLLHPLIHSMVTCIPLSLFPLFTIRLVVFAVLYAREGESALAPLSLVLDVTALFSAVTFLFIFYFSQVKKWTLDQWVQWEWLRKTVQRMLRASRYILSPARVSEEV